MRAILPLHNMEECFIVFNVAHPNIFEVSRPRPETVEVPVRMSLLSLRKVDFLAKP